MFEILNCLTLGLVLWWVSFEIDSITTICISSYSRIIWNFISECYRSPIYITSLSDSDPGAMYTSRLVVRFGMF